MWQTMNQCGKFVIGYANGFYSSCFAPSKMRITLPSTGNCSKTGVSGEIMDPQPFHLYSILYSIHDIPWYTYVLSFCDLVEDVEHLGLVKNPMGIGTTCRSDSGGLQPPKHIGISDVWVVFFHHWGTCQLESVRFYISCIYHIGTFPDTYATNLGTFTHIYSVSTVSTYGTFKGSSLEVYVWWNSWSGMGLQW